jgi:glutaredoxin
MPIRKKIGRILRRISGLPTVDTHAPTPSTVEHPPVISIDTPTLPSEKETTSSSGTNSTVPELILYGRPSCPYCARVDRVIEELDLEDKLTRRLTSYGSEWRDDLRSRTGSTQVPCLFIDGEPMFESLDIIDWMRANLA